MSKGMFAAMMAAFGLTFAGVAYADEAAAPAGGDAAKADKPAKKAKGGKKHAKKDKKGEEKKDGDAAPAGDAK